MKKDRYGYQMSDDDESDSSSGDEKQKTEGDVEYQFEGFDVEINAKVTLLPKTTSKP